MIIWELEAGKGNGGMRPQMTCERGRETQRRFVEPQCCRRDSGTLCQKCPAAPLRKGQSPGTYPDSSKHAFVTTRNRIFQ